MSTSKQKKGQHPDASPPRKWKPEHFHQSNYSYEDTALDSAKRITYKLSVNGRDLVTLQAREPGILAIVSRPDSDGIDFIIVEPGGARYIDMRMPDFERAAQVEPWALELLGIAKR